MGSLARAAAHLVPGFAGRGFSRPVALFFHGVAETVNDPVTAENHHDAATFRAIAKSLKRHYDVRPLADIDAVLREPERHSRSVFLMSDDGYANTASVAADILSELSLPWTLFVSTHHIDTGEPNPIFLARMFFAYAADGIHQLGPLGSVELNARSRLAASAWIAQLKALPFELAQETVEAMLKAPFVRDLAGIVAEHSAESFLTWATLRALRSSGVEIGAHAHVHWPMHAGQSSDYLRVQAQHSRDRVEAEVGPCRFFAYPFGNIGDVSEGAWQAVRHAGYEYGFSTCSGSLDASANPFLMPRYGIGPRDTHISGIVPILRMANRRLVQWQHSLGGFTHSDPNLKHRVEPGLDHTQPVNTQ